MFCNLKKLTKRYKNKKILFYFMSILSIFFITDNVSALTLEVNGEQVDVTKENYIYYVYQKYPSYFNNYTYFVASNDLDRNKYYNVWFSNCKFTHDSGEVYKTNGCEYVKIHTTSLDKEFTVGAPQSYPNIFLGSPQYLLYANYDITKVSDGSVVFSSNITKDLLSNYGISKNKYIITYYINNEIYKEIEVEEGSSHDLLIYEFNEFTHIFSGWQYDENIDFTNITSDITINATLEEKDIIPVYIEFPITKNEFYALLVEVGLLIMIIFLKWCFPFKGGSDLK